MENFLLVKNWRDTAARKRIDSLYKTEQAHIISGHVIYIILSIIVYEYNYSELWAFSHIRAPVGPMLPG